MNERDAHYFVLLFFFKTTIKKFEDLGISFITDNNVVIIKKRGKNDYY